MQNNNLKTVKTLCTTVISIILSTSLMLAAYPSNTVWAQATTTSTTTLPTTIETDTAAAAAESYTIQNTNDVQTVTKDPATTTASSTANSDLGDILTIDNEPSATSSTSTTSQSNEPTATTTASSSIEVDINQTATASTTASTTADTGNNTASSPDTALVSTGDAYSYNNVVNLTNTNIIDSIGFIVFLNQLFGTGDTDLRELFDVFSTSSTSQPCDESGCEARSLSYYANSTSTLENNLTVSASTGNNQASGTTALISTGDAYAAANVTNIANTNIVDANYLVLTFSNFGDLLGDIVLPGKELLLKLFQSHGGASDQSIVTDSTATITNNVATEATSGNNTATGSESVVQTGNATTYNNVYNQVNTNVINNDSITMLFRVSGDWDGEVFGLPDGLSWQRTAAGIEISNGPSFGSTAESTRAINAELTSAANIDNNVTVTANTGNNQTNASEAGYIETGDAYAAANVTNIANTNILGRNWSLLIFDIFGNWNGDISFGRPDLWIGGVANARNGTTGAGQELTYTFTVSNLGDAAARDVTLNGQFNSDLMTFAQPMQDINLGNVEPGETLEHTVTAKVTSNLSQGSHPVDLTATLHSPEPDENLANNTEVVTIMAENIRRSGSRSGFTANDITRTADLTITKSAAQSSITSGETASYKVTITNSGGPVFGAMLYDHLYDPTGVIIDTKQWELGTIDPDETVVITYDTQYASTSAAGTYLNRAQVLGYHKNRKPGFMQTYDSMIATVALSVSGANPLVLGVAASSELCEPYLTSFLRQNQPNDPAEVTKLQSFLNDHTTFTTTTSGVFDNVTARAVRDFQQQHAADILNPWGIAAPTGHVYYTTKKKINELYCDEQIEFPLSPTQLSEINRFKFAHTLRPVTPDTAPSAPEETQVIAVKPEPTTVPKPTLIPIARAEELTQSLPTLDTTPTKTRLLDRFTNWITRPNLSALKFW